MEKKIAETGKDGSVADCGNVTTGIFPGAG